MNDRKKDLIFVIGSLEVGGAERHLINLLPALVAKGWSAKVIVIAKKGILASNLEKQGIPVICLLTDLKLKIIEKLPHLLGRIVRIIFCVISLSRKLKQEKKSLIHFFLPEAYVVGMVGAKLAGFSGPKIMSRRSLNNYQKRRTFLAWIEKKLHSQMTAILGNSVAVIAQLKKEGAPVDRLKLIYNGINVEAFFSTQSREEVRKNLGISLNSFLIVKVANYIPYKGHGDLLNALSKIKDKLPQDWYLLCAGRDDGIGDSLKQKTKELGLEKHVLWVGSRNDIANLLFAADMSVLCSHQEGFANAILESMAAGLPMVVTDVGGNKEAVLEGKTGYVVPSKDPVALARAILQLANQPEKLKAFGWLAQQRVKEHFSMDACVNAYIKLYEDCLVQREGEFSQCAV